jgi:hypothetical protein
MGFENLTPQQILQKLLEMALGQQQQPAPAAGEAVPAALPVAGDPAAQAGPAGWLAGTWQGQVTVQQRKTGEPPTSQRIPYTAYFDALGRPLMDLSNGRYTTITHVGQTHSAGLTTFTVRELTWSPDGCRVVLTSSYDRVRQYEGVWGAGYAAAATSTSSASTTTLEYRREGTGLRVILRVVAEMASGMRVLTENSTSRECSETALFGVLQRA